MTMSVCEFPDEELIESTAEMVLSTFLDAPASLISNELAEEKTAGQEFWSGSITISGPFSGVITVSCQKEFLRECLRFLVKGGCDVESDDAARDFLAEMTNVVGGNIKSLFSMSSDHVCFLSLPIVAAGKIQVHGESKRFIHAFIVHTGVIFIAIHALKNDGVNNNAHAAVGLSR